MTKVLPLLLLAVMALHLFRPIGVPGLRKRSDVWKIALFALGMMGLTVLLTHSAG